MGEMASRADAANARADERSTSRDIGAHTDGPDVAIWISDLI